MNVGTLQVVGAVCFGVIGYYANDYYYDFGVKTAEWISLVINTGQLDVWKPVLFFFLTCTACLINTVCIFVACLISSNTAFMMNKTVYVSTDPTLYQA